MAQGKRKTYRIETRRVNDPKSEWKMYPNCWGVSKDWAEGFLFCMDGFYGGKYDSRMVDEETGEVLRELTASCNAVGVVTSKTHSFKGKIIAVECGYIKTEDVPVA